MQTNKLILISFLAAFQLLLTSSAQALDPSTTEEILNARIDYLEQRLINSDFDNDGFSPSQGDCDDTNASINPDATTAEVGGDGIDNNCDGKIDDVALSSDVDNDGLSDWDECSIYHTDPSNADTDADSLPPIRKLQNYSCNCKKVCSLPGPFGICYQYTQTCDTCQRWVDSAPAVDMGDWAEVFQYGTNPTLADTDGDQINDGVEIRNSTDPVNPESY